MKQSKKYSLNKADLKSLAITLALAAISAVLVKAIELVPSVDFGQNSELFVVVILAVLKSAQKFVAGK